LDVTVFLQVDGADLTGLLADLGPLALTGIVLVWLMLKYGRPSAMPPRNPGNNQAVERLAQEMRRAVDAMSQWHRDTLEENRTDRRELKEGVGGIHTRLDGMLTTLGKIWGVISRTGGVAPPDA
jgi:hypothetical protein